MAIIKRISVSNLRSLRDVGGFSLRPINVLVGRNSSGKSTYARVLPLLKQSLSGGGRDPLLWWGAYTDFGSFRDAIGSYRKRGKDKASPDYIQFEISYEDGADASVAEKGGTYLFRIKEKGGGYDSSYVSYVKARIGGIFFDILFTEDNRVECININGKQMYREGDITDIHLLNDSSSIFPEISAYMSTGAGLKRQPSLMNAFVERDEKKLSPVIYLIDSAFGGFKFYRVDQFRDFIKEIDREFYDSRIKNLDDDLLALVMIPTFFNTISTELEAAIGQSSYIEPLRAVANRFYRRQNIRPLVDGKGENIAMFFSYISRDARKNFNSWLESHFGFKVDTDERSDHVSVVLEDIKSKNKKNIADMGFGYSQLLPILVQLWIVGTGYGGLKRKSIDKSGKVVIIEQPELHLHPAYQSKVADIFSAYIKEFNSAGDISLIVETHSPNIVNRLGSLISEGLLSKEDVQVVLFDFSSEDLSTSINISEYDDDGILRDWPIGFFEPEFA